MTIAEVAGLLGYSTERVETLIAKGVVLPKSGTIIRLTSIDQRGKADISDGQFDDFVAKFEAEEPGRWPPAAVRRELLVEAHHRCIICRDGPPLQFHHMLDWAIIKHHDPRHMLAVCGTCHTRCTNGFIDYKSQVGYKERIEQGSRQIGTASVGTPIYRKIEDHDQRQWLSIGERAALRALEDEFGCDVRPDIKIAAGDGWLNLHAAVIRGEDLVAIEIHENKGNGIRFFMIDHLIQLGSQLKLERFHKFVLYIVVVSTADLQSDDHVRAELQKRAKEASYEVCVRMWRLNDLRFKYKL